MNKEQVLQRNDQVKNKSIGWLCTYVPEEIIIACGFTPTRITGDRKAKRSEGYFPINFCPYVKSSMEEIMERKKDLGGMIFTNSCDAMKRFYDLTKKYIPGLPAFMLDVPRNKDELAFKHYSNNLSSMMDFLDGINNRQTGAEELGSAMELCNKKRSLLKKLQALYRALPDVIKTRKYFEMAKSAMTADPYIFMDELEEFTIACENTIRSRQRPENKPGNYPEEKPGIMIVGNFIEEDGLWDIFDGLDCRIVADDLCNSSRYFGDVNRCRGFDEIMGSDYYRGIIKRPGPGTEGLLAEVALRYLFKPQCMRMSDLEIKTDEIKSSIEKNKVRGLIFISQKFCDNTLLFYPLLRQYLNDIRIPSLFLEIEHNNLSAGQIKTRIQAFIEII